MAATVDVRACKTILLLSTWTSAVQWHGDKSDSAQVAAVRRSCLVASVSTRKARSLECIPMCESQRKVGWCQHVVGGTYESPLRRKLGSSLVGKAAQHHVFLKEGGGGGGSTPLHHYKQKERYGPKTMVWCIRYKWAFNQCGRNYEPFQIPISVRTKPVRLLLESKKKKKKTMSRKAY